MNTKKSPKNPIAFKLLLSEEQKLAKAKILESKVTLLEGAAGSGKTLLSCNVALDLLAKKEIGRILITRPTVKATETDDLGLLPGDIKDKLGPWTDPMIDNMQKLMGKPIIDKRQGDGDILMKPIQFMRGITIDNEVLLVDESQNLTTAQLKLILTRLGKKSKIIFTGDYDQCDLSSKHNSGILKLKDLSKSIPEICIITLKENHRDSFVTKVLDNWDNSVE